jgi:hypothetical protein
MFSLYYTYNNNNNNNNNNKLKRNLRCEINVRIKQWQKQMSRLEDPLMVFQISII